MRREDWDQVLSQYLAASKYIEFKWGDSDCALWASSFVDQVLGTHYASAWKGLYETEEGATALMQERGYANPEAIADAFLESKPVRRAMRGDLVLHESGALGICEGRRSWFLTPDRGLCPVLTLNCKKAWSV